MILITQIGEERGGPSFNEVVERLLDHSYFVPVVCIQMHNCHIVKPRLDSQRRNTQDHYPKDWSKSHYKNHKRHTLKDCFQKISWVNCDIS